MIFGLPFQARGAVKYLTKNYFTYKDSSGVTWYCCELIRDEKMGAAVYGCDGATPELTIPAKVTDKAGNKWPVTDVVSRRTIDSNGWDRFLYNEDEGSEELGILRFPASVVNIGDDVFNTNGEDKFLLLNEIYLPNSQNLVIGTRAFLGCGSDNGPPFSGAGHKRLGHTADRSGAARAERHGLAQSDRR